MKTSTRLNSHSPASGTSTVNVTSPPPPRDTVPLIVLMITTLLSGEMSPVALMAKAEKSTSVLRGLPKRSTKPVAAKVMGDVVVGLAVVRVKLDSGAKTPGLKASEVTIEGASME